LLRLAERELYVLAWSERILDEVSRNLVDDGRTDETTAARLQAAMRAAFPEALVNADAIAATEPTMQHMATVLPLPDATRADVEAVGHRALRHAELFSALAKHRTEGDAELAGIEAEEVDVGVGHVERRAPALPGAPWAAERIPCDAGGLRLASARDADSGMTHVAASAEGNAHASHAAMPDPLRGRYRSR